MTYVAGSSLDDDRRAEFGRSVKVRLGEKATTLTVTDAVLKAQTATAMKGNAIAQRSVLLQTEAVERRDSQRTEQLRVDKEARYYG